MPRRLHALPASACELASPVPCTCSTGVPDQRGRTAAPPAVRGPTGARPAGALGRPGAGAAAAQRRVRAHLPRHVPGHLRHCKGARRATCSDAALAARPTAVCTSHAAAARLRAQAAAAIGLCMRPRRQPLDMLAILFQQLDATGGGRGVQVCNTDRLRTMAGVPLEAVLSVDAPRGLVPTVAFTTSRSLHRASERQTWLLQAYCNRGTLAVRGRAARRGCSRRVRGAVMRDASRAGRRRRGGESAGCPQQWPAAGSCLRVCGAALGARLPDAPSLTCPRRAPAGCHGARLVHMRGRLA